MFEGFPDQLPDVGKMVGNLSNGTQPVRKFVTGISFSCIPWDRKVNLSIETLIMHPQNKEQVIALKAIAKAWKISVETSPYDPDFVAMVKKAEKRGNYTDVDPKDA